MFRKPFIQRSYQTITRSFTSKALRRAMLSAMIAGSSLTTLPSVNASDTDTRGGISILVHEFAGTDKQSQATEQDSAADAAEESLPSPGTHDSVPVTSTASELDKNIAAAVAASIAKLGISIEQVLEPFAMVGPIANEAPTAEQLDGSVALNRWWLDTETVAVAKTENEACVEADDASATTAAIEELAAEEPLDVQEPTVESSDDKLIGSSPVIVTIQDAYLPYDLSQRDLELNGLSLSTVVPLKEKNYVLKPETTQEEADSVEVAAAEELAMEVAVVEETAEEADFVEVAVAEEPAMEVAVVEEAAEEADFVEVAVAEEPAMEVAVVEEAAEEADSVEVAVAEEPAMEVAVVEEAAEEADSVEVAVPEEPAMEVAVVEEAAEEADSVEVAVAEEPAMEVAAVEEAAEEADFVEVAAAEEPATEVAVVEEAAEKADSVEVAVVEESAVEAVVVDEVDVAVADVKSSPECLLDTLAHQTSELAARAEAVDFTIARLGESFGEWVASLSEPRAKVAKDAAPALLAEVVVEPNASTEASPVADIEDDEDSVEIVSAAIGSAVVCPSECELIAESKDVEPTEEVAVAMMEVEGELIPAPVADPAADAIEQIAMMEVDGQAIPAPVADPIPNGDAQEQIASSEDDEDLATNEPVAMEAELADSRPEAEASIEDLIATISQWQREAIQSILNVEEPALAEPAAAVAEKVDASTESILR
ncbi:hypothetical protein [Neorhodopirellula pilleata]|uniref:Uncharacterized protein n=1 Tax=Neorhodopirellula pilleata TaxID=2714738 RepID=A0A5C6ARD8_9BACT|nr:hypothetical protein [Neorhodopirellula pilleata]TWU02067.1 hypothetical protein Pla100_18070 [Neorhodopirellula pilleata]